MKSLKRIGSEPMSLALSADDIVEFHAARLLLLFRICGVSNRIDGLTKMAKLDFFVRYPDFFQAAKAAVAPDADPGDTSNAIVEATEAAMVRHHYGPWDKRYYQVLASLESRRLIEVTKEKSSYRLSLTATGKERADLLAKTVSFTPVVARMKDVKRVFGGKSGDYLKRLIYRLFDTEVGQREMGKVITK
ncbi:hypothetical protein [Lysobacter capsici]|uniref:hypothetical protein n=1 Tax=Lysobacter capsici TaxID=435897 RepID=UPI00287BADC6|nr:hypothetical protein [Lysobacter capsici]WND81121.1 hypothetical protein RJ610_01715 [Lysobacter capsici]WND86317.1 hypothetical protein RJ609_01715 [Lysobacter capsici]